MACSKFGIPVYDPEEKQGLGFRGYQFGTIPGIPPRGREWFVSLGTRREREGSPRPWTYPKKNGGFGEKSVRPDLTKTDITAKS